MTRTLESFAAVGWLADNGKGLLTRVGAEASVSVTRNHEAKAYVATIVVFSAKTGETIATCERPFSRLEQLMDLLGIDDIDEVWEVLDI